MLTKFRKKSELLSICFALCMLGIFSTADLKLSKKLFQEYHLDPDRAQHFVGPYLGVNCLQRLLADDTSRQLVCKVYFDKKIVFAYIIALYMILKSEFFTKRDRLNIYHIVSL